MTQHKATLLAREIEAQMASYLKATMPSERVTTEDKEAYMRVIDALYAYATYVPTPLGNDTAFVVPLSSLECSDCYEASQQDNANTLHYCAVHSGTSTARPVDARARYLLSRQKGG